MTTPRPIKILFFAVLREQAGRAELTVTTAAATPQALYAELRATLPLTLSETLLRVAINGRYATLDAALHAGDQVVFIPPVAGG